MGVQAERGGSGGGAGECGVVGRGRRSGGRVCFAERRDDGDRKVDCTHGFGSAVPKRVYLLPICDLGLGGCRMHITPPRS